MFYFRVNRTSMKNPLLCRIKKENHLAGMSYDIVKYADDCYHLIALKRVTTLFLLRTESVCFIFYAC